MRAYISLQRTCLCVMKSLRPSYTRLYPQSHSGHPTRGCIPRTSLRSPLRPYSKKGNLQKGKASDSSDFVFEPYTCTPLPHLTACFANATGVPCS